MVSDLEVQYCGGAVLIVIIFNRIVRIVRVLLYGASKTGNALTG